MYLKCPNSVWVYCLWLDHVMFPPPACVSREVQLLGKSDSHLILSKLKTLSFIKTFNLGVKIGHVSKDINKNFLLKHFATLISL